MTQLLICTGAILLLTACSTTVPVTGETADGERFSGTFNRRTGAYSGSVALGSDKGAVCEGRWQLDEQRTGSAVIICNDGRTGTGELSTQEANGTLSGMLGGQPLKGSFENPLTAPRR